MKSGAESSQDDIAFVPLVEYDSGEPEFIRGTEVGYLEAKIELLGSITIRELMRRTNEEMVRRLTTAAGRTFHTEPLDSEWMSVTIDPLPTNGGHAARHAKAHPPAER
jgi:hypothetical protein